LDTEGRVTLWNEAAEAIFGWRREEVLGNAIPFVPAEKMEEFESLLGRVLSGEKLGGVDLERRRKDGSTVDIRLFASPTYDAKGAVTGLMAMAEDISERKRAEAETKRALADLADEKARTESIVASIADGISIQDTDFRIVYQNEALRKIIGDHVGEHCYEVYERRGAVCTGCPVAMVFEDGKAHTAERTGVTGSGPVHVEIKAAPIRDAEGNIVGGVEVVRDISERKGIEGQLRKRIGQQAAVVQFGQLALWGIDFDELLQDAARLAADILEVEFAKVMELQPGGGEMLLRAGVGWKEGLVGEARIRAEADSQPGYTLKTGEPVIVEDWAEETKFRMPQLLRDHGVQSGMSVAILGREVPYGVLGVHSSRKRQFPPSDIDFLSSIAILLAEAWDLNKTENLLRRAKQEWEDVFNTITDIITVHDADFNIIRANAAAREALDLPLLTTKKAKCYKHYHGTGCPPQGCPSCRAFETGEPTVSEFFEPHLNRYVEIRAIPQKDGGGRLTGLIHVVRDISERKDAEEKIKRSLERLEALRAIDMAISSSLDLGLTLNVALDWASNVLKADAASVLLLNTGTRTLQHRTDRGFRTAGIKKSSVRVGEGCAGRAAYERKSISVPDLKEPEPEYTRAELISEEGFASLFCAPLLAKGEVKGVLELYSRAPFAPDPDWRGFVETLATQLAIAIDSAALFEDLQRSNFELSLAYDATIEGWSRALDYRDKETKGHSQRVTETTVAIARAMGMGDEELVHIRRGALLHDIGKLGVPDAILFKPGRLDEEEWEVMKRHPVLAQELLSPIDYLVPAIEIPYCHHEKWDGSGYPRGLKGREIPLGARIFAVVDVWDALSSDRPYRPAWPEEKVLGYLRERAGKDFDPEVVEAFFGLRTRGEQA
ncbi:MAG: PAS domain-containing protein, partial [Nitrospirota bacterium]